MSTIHTIYLVVHSIFSDSTIPKRVYDIPVLSGSAYVGQLYDATKDQLMFDRFLWSNISVNEADITSVETDTYIEESVTDRTQHMGVSASIQASLFAGLVQVCVLKFLKKQRLVMTQSKF